MEATAKKKSAKKAPKPTSDRKRPNKSFIMQMAEFRGHMTCNEKTLLEGLSVKNVLQRVNNRAMGESQMPSVECAEIQRLMKAFVKAVDEQLAKAEK